MTDSIGTRLTALISPIVPLYLSEASTDTYPYAVYSQTLAYRRDKDEVYAITADTEIHVYGKVFGEVEAKARQIVTKLESDMRDGTYVATLRTVDRDRVQEIWDIQLSYTIKQLK